LININTRVDLAKDARITSVFDLALSVCLFVRINVEISGVAMHTLTTKNSPKLTHTAQNGHAYTLEIIFYIYINKFRVRISTVGEMGLKAYK